MDEIDGDENVNIVRYLYRSSGLYINTGSLLEEELNKWWREAEIT